MAKSLSFHVRNIRKWKLSLILLSVAIIAVTLSTIFVIPTVRIFMGRSGEWTEAVQNPIRRAEYLPISSKLVQDNAGLREALSCADERYEILVRSKGYGTPTGQVCDERISMYDADMIKREIQYSVYGYSHYRIEYDGKYYFLIIPPA